MIQLGGSFHATTLGKLPSIVKYGILPGGDKGTRGSAFFNHYAPWDTRATTILRSKVPTEDVPIVLYVPIAYLQRLGARLAESSYVVMFQGVPWDCVKSAWYRDPVHGRWKRLLTKGVTNHLITASRYANKIATKEQIAERAKEVIKQSTRRDDNIRRLDELVIHGDTRKSKQEPWNVIIARTCEGYNNIDGNILCPACMSVTPIMFTLCLHCHGPFFSCGVKNTISTDDVIEIDDNDEEAETKKDPEAEKENDPDKEKQKVIDKAKMEEIKSAIQSQIVQDDDDEEMNQENIEGFWKEKDQGSKKDEGHELFTPTFNDGEVDYERDSQAPQVEEVIDEQEAMNKSTADFYGTTDKVVEEIEAEDTKRGAGRIGEDEYGREDPDEHLANHELPKWCRYPEPVPFDPQDEAGCQDTITGSSALMDRYLDRCMAQIIKPMYTSYHTTGIARFRELFSKKRLDVMSDFTDGVGNGFDDDDMPKDPTEKQMQAFAEWKKVTTKEAWYMFRGEQMLRKFALQAVAFVYTPESFKAEFVQTNNPPPGTKPEMVEASKRAKQESMSRLIKKCVNAIYSVNSYSYFRNDLEDTSMRKCIIPLYSRAQNKWDTVVILVMDQANITLLPAAKW